MLVLSRKVGESFVIGDNIVVTVVQVGSNGVRLGFEATGDHEILRQELHAALAREAGKDHRQTELPS